MGCEKKAVCMVFGSMVARCPYRDCPEVDEDGHWLPEEEEANDG